MKGFVPTPQPTVDLMVEKLFRYGPPSPQSRVLDPGSGLGAFVDGVIRYCKGRGVSLPTIVAIESDPAHVDYLRAKFAGTERVVVRQADFLTMRPEPFDYIVGNPPYVSIGGLTSAEKAEYRRTFATAVGRFDLYILFFEQAMKSLVRGGKLVFVTPEKYLYVNTAAALRGILSASPVSELHFLPEDTFADRVTYPLVTSVDFGRGHGRLQVTDRDGSVHEIHALLSKSSWLPVVRRAPEPSNAPRLADIVHRISCGVATGADSVFLVHSDEVPNGLHEFGYPTLAGREIVDTRHPGSRSTMLVPYTADGLLLPEKELGDLGEYLGEPTRRARLLKRTCAATKPWYAFHETPPMREMLRPKLLCKDIGAKPIFVVDHSGEILPRHSLYYIVPQDVGLLEELADFLNSAIAGRWLRDHCQRAANGFLRLQSHVLRQIPLPESLQPKTDQLQLGVGDIAALRSA